MNQFDIKELYDKPLSLRIAIIFLICAIVFLAGYFLDIASLKNELSRHKKQEIELKAKANTLIQQEVKLDNQIKSSEKTKQLFVQWESALIRFKHTPELLNQILKIAANNQLYVFSFLPAKAEDVQVLIMNEDKTNSPNQAIEGQEAEPILNHYNKIPIKLVAIGNYRDIATFVSQIANLNWIVSIENLLITNENNKAGLNEKLAAEASAQKKLTLNMNLSIYFVKDDYHAYS